MRKPHALTPEMKAFIDQNYTKILQKDIAKRLGVCAETIRIYYKEKGYKIIHRYGEFLLTDEQKKFIDDNYSTMPIHQIHLTLNKSTYLIREYMRKKNYPTIYSRIRGKNQSKVIQMSEFFDHRIHKAFF